MIVLFSCFRCFNQCRACWQSCLSIPSAAIVSLNPTHHQCVKNQFFLTRIVSFTAEDVLAFSTLKTDSNSTDGGVKHLNLLYKKTSV